MTPSPPPVYANVAYFRIPEFETRTVNGGLRIDFPITVQGELTGRRGLSTTLGAGGPLIRARTTNGGVTVRRR